jgi:hypothetical protein
LSTLPQEVGVNRRPWYREPWPWLLMAGPLASVIAGFVTLWLAVKTDDGLVAEDYYKEGLAINQLLHRDHMSAELGYEATLNFDFDHQLLRARMSSETGAAIPRVLRLRIVHPTRSGADQTVELPTSGASRFDGAIKPLSAGRWLLILEDATQSWRLTGEMRAPRDEEVVLQPREG